MVEILSLLGFGLVVGTYGTLVGIGGGPLIVPFIALLYQYETPTIISVSLFVIFCNTLSGSIAYIKDKRVDLISGTKFGLATIPGALLSTFGVYYIHLHLFTFIFGLLLIILAGYIFIKPVEPIYIAGRYHPNAKRGLRGSFTPKRTLIYPLLNKEPWDDTDENTLVETKHHKERIIKDVQGNVYRYQINESLGIVLTGLIGFFSTFLGIGGGLFQVPVMIYLLSFPVHVATATSHYITAINSCFTLIPFMVNGDIAYRPAITLSIGVVIGAQIGARLSHKVSDKTLLNLLIPVFIFMGIKLILFS
ncbi:MAG: sulfite exporter TauE/SafE family protein [Desulfobacterales bacterium]|nr:sulfite exporter TauE/SafE family protein [Desulfobacterales bacterium]